MEQGGKAKRTIEVGHHVNTPRWRRPTNFGGVSLPVHGPTFTDRLWARPKVGRSRELLYKKNSSPGGLSGGQRRVWTLKSLACLQVHINPNSETLDHPSQVIVYQIILGH